MSWISKWVYGVDLDEEQARGDAADAKLKEENQKLYGPGGAAYEKIAENKSEADALLAYQQVQRNEETGATGDVDAQVTDSFEQGIKESIPAQAASGIVTAANTGLSYAAKGIWKIIPWYLWVIILGGIALFVFVQIKPFIPRKSS